jgi:hypothetical protein
MQEDYAMDEWAVNERLAGNDPSTDGLFVRWDARDNPLVF